MTDRVTIKIPKELYTTLQEQIRGTGFASVTEFVVFVMRSLASTGHLRNGDSLTDDEIAVVRERLKRLGYL
jgi:Arc/MetJ-type ribon-helix-helix transcriptional regulator